MISMGFYFMDFMMMLEWVIMNYGSMNLEIYILLDWVSFLFMSVVLLISSMIFIYSSVYMKGDNFSNRFILLVFMFIMSMILMIISPNIFSILFGWDGLGLVSYCLVIYYQNYSSYNSGMVTVLCNRIGDIGLIMSIGLMVSVSGSCSLKFIQLKIIVMLMILAAMTKSAQIPFSSWLPMAMAAPTPVSALVHSSTLVTAGVYLLIRFNNLLIIMNLNKYVLFFSVLTMFMSGLMANFEYDLKKVIALSTLSQLGLMMMILSLGFSMVSMFHLLTHAIFKSLLFMCAGIMIHLMNNNQDIRVYGSLNEFIPFTMMSFYVANLSLCGMPFMAGFYSKDFIMEMVYMDLVNYLLLFMIVISLAFTVSYSVRLFYYLYFSEMKVNLFMNIKEDKIMNFSMVILTMLSIIIGSVLWWMFFYDFYSSYLNMNVKLLTLSVCVLGVLIWMISKCCCWVCLDYLKFYLLNYFLSSMWFLNYLMEIIYGPLNKFGGSVYSVDKNWVEYSGRLMMKMVLLNYMKFNLNLFNIYMLMFMFISIFMVMYFLI
uniref:NADH-ubiquinone oxidoreductase chain 5 n=1 Tax=Dorymyrmex brunneus TaxID=609524 RepID=A0A343YVE2_9HYME|nr:NADH dehydrogenase subunit 5 [Dorymyrmex brunneus]